MNEFVERIKDRPVRFNALLHALLGLIALLGLLTEEIIGGIVLAVNAFLAFWLDGYTVSLYKNGNPRNPEYRKV